LKRIKDRLKILKLARKKKRVILQEADYWKCEDLVHQGLLHKSFPNHSRAHGWPEYRLSQRGYKFLERSLARSR